MVSGHMTGAIILQLMTGLLLKKLIKDICAQLIGPVRQKLPNGIRSQKHFRLLREHLRASKVY